jgi:hypothetical protein
MEKDLTSLLQPSAECSELAETITMLDGTRGQERQLNCQQHVAACAYCSSQLALFREFDSAEPRPEEKKIISEIVSQLRRDSPAASAPWWKRINWRPRVWIPGSLGIAAMALLLVMMLTPRVDRFPSLTPSGDTVLRSVQVVPISPLGDVQLKPLTLRWQPVDHAASYRVRLLEVDRTELWSLTVAAAVAEIPASTRTKIVPAKKLLWEVTASDSAGQVLAQSGEQSFSWQSQPR